MNRSTVISIAAVASALVATGLNTGAAYGTTEPPTSDTDLARASEAALAESGQGTVTSFEVDRDGYDVEVRLSDGTDLDVDLDLDFVVVRTRADDQDGEDRNIDTDNVDLQQASDAALGEVGEGTVVSVEVDEGGGYDVEIVLDNRAELDIDLNADFEVVRTERDD